MGQNRCHTGIPFFIKGDEEWINSRTGGEANFQIFTALRMRQQTQLSDSPHIPAHGANGDLGVLPSRGITKAFLDAFHQSFLRLVFPVVDYTLFQETIAAAYEAARRPVVAEANRRKGMRVGLHLYGGGFVSRKTVIPSRNGLGCVLPRGALLSAKHAR